MTKSILTAAFALMMGFTVNSFAEGKTDPKVSATEPTQSNTTARASLYWFATDAAGNVTGTTARDNTPSTDDPSGCNGSGASCSKGFDESQTDVVGGNRVLITGAVESDQSFQN